MNAELRLVRNLICALMLLTTHSMAFGQGSSVSIPALHYCNNYKYRITTMEASVKVQTLSAGTGSESGSGASGSFEVSFNVTCGPGKYPGGELNAGAFSGFRTDTEGVIATDILESNAVISDTGSTGWVTGKCRDKNGVGCYFWLMAVDNDPDLPSRRHKGKTMDFVSLIVVDVQGQLLIHAAGSLVRGFVVIKLD